MKKAPSDRSASDAVSQQALRQQAEARLAQSPDIPKPLSPDEIREALHELRVHQIELEMQNEELRTARDEIEAGRTRYFDLYDLAPVGYCTLSEQGLILEANLTAATLLGAPRGKLVKRPLSNFIFKEDQDSYYLHRKKLLESGQSQECELRLLKPDGAVFWAQLTATAAQAEDGAPVCRVVLLDVTERKRAEKDRFEMAERYRLANKATNDVIWDWDIVNDAQRWNEAGTAVFGWTDIVEAPQTAAWWMDRVHPEDRPRMERLFEAAVGNPAVARWNDEYRFRKADGTYAFVVDRGHILRDADGRAVRMIGAMLDLTDRKHAEDELERSRQLLDATEALSAVGGWEWDVEGQVMSWTDGTYRIHDLDAVAMPAGSPEHIQRSLACYDPGDRPRVEAAFRRCVEAGEPYDVECGFTSAKGRRLCVRTRGQAVRENGRTVKVTGNLQDITERKQAEEALRESEDRFSTAFRTSPFAISITRAKDGKFIEVNDAFTTMTGFSREEALATSSIGLMLWGTVKDRDQVVNDLLAGRTVIGREYQFRKKGETTFMGSFSARTIRLGGESCILSSIEDITERKQAEERVRLEQVFSKTIIESIPGPFYVLDESGRYVRWNAYQRDEIIGRPEEEAAGLSAIDTIHPDDRDLIGARIANVLKMGTVETVEGRVLLRGGPAFRWFLMTGRRMVVDGKALLVGIGIDITERKRAEGSLRESEARFRGYVEHAPYGVFVVDGQGRYVDVNPAAERLSGYSAAQLTSMCIPDLLAEESREIGVSQFQTLLAAGRLVTELRYRHADGSLRYWSVSATRIGPDRYLGFVEDITERNLAEVALREEHERLENVLSATRTGIDIVDGDFNLHYVDRGWQKVYGDPTGRKCYEYFNGLSAPCPGCGIPKALATKLPVITDEVIPREGNRPIEVHILPFQNADGQWLVAEINIDITDRKKASEALKASETRFKELLLRVPTVAVQGYALDGTVRYWNHASEAFYGYTEKEALDKNLLDLVVPPDLRDYVRTSIRRMVETGETLPAGEVELMRKDGSLIPVYSAHALVQLPGQDPELFCLDIDLTERKKAESEQEKLQAQFLQAQKMESVGRLAGGVAHDFNNLLMGIMGYVELCLEELAPNHPIREYLNEIMHGAERSAEITRQLLAFARKQTIAPKVLDFSDPVVRMLKLLQRLIGEDIKITWRPGSGLPLVRIDPSQIDQILANLCVNARDAIAGVGEIALETGSIVVDADYCAKHPEASPGVYVFLAVRDNGCGMDKETLAQVFEPFFTTKGLGNGTGLGLATVYGIVKQNNGFICADSEPGKGTTFTIYLPEVDAEAKASVTPKADAPRGRGETVLLVEDEKALRVTCGAFLEALGYHVLVAETPGEALNMIAGHPGAIHVLLTDVVMPGMDGRQLAQRLRAVKPDLKVLFMSGYTSDVIAQRGVLDDGVQFLSKPFKRDALARKVREVLEAD
jgi:PAS domain S-box-containing protein